MHYCVNVGKNLPQENPWPSFVRAIVWFWPHATLVTVCCASACICFGRGCGEYISFTDATTEQMMLHCCFMCVLAPERFKMQMHAMFFSSIQCVCRDSPRDSSSSQGIGAALVPITGRMHSSACCTSLHILWSEVHVEMGIPVLSYRAV